jgi:hypothetical protein
MTLWTVPRDGPRPTPPSAPNTLDRGGLCAGQTSIHPKRQGKHEQEQYEERNRSFGASDHACNLPVPPN